MEKRKSQVDKYIQVKRKNLLLKIGLAVLLMILAALSMLMGQYDVSVSDTLSFVLGISAESDAEAETLKNIMLNIRLPRTLAAVLIGGVLSLAGLTYQCVFRNMLVSQDILGVSTGACVGAAAAIIMDLSILGIQGLSFSCGIASVILVFLLSKVFKSDRTLSLILSGVLISGLMSSVLGYIKYTADPATQLQSIIFWIMGDISSVNMRQLLQISIPAAVCTVLIYINRWKLNLFCYSDSEAQNLGFNIKIYRALFIVCATVMVSLAVSVSGAIGWIGLVMPQLARTICGNDNVDTTGISFLLGADFLLMIDIINRLVSKAELPVSILTGLIGTPIFVICLVLKQRGAGYGSNT